MCFYFVDFFMNVCYIFIIIWGVIGSVQVEGVVGSGGVCVIFYYVIVFGGIIQVFFIFKIGILMGKEFVGRVDRFDKIIMGFVVIVRQ